MKAGGLLLGRKVQVVYPATIIDEKAKHWWQLDKIHVEDRVFHTGEVVDRADSSAEYAIACEDGKIRWVWSSNLRIIE